MLKFILSIIEMIFNSKEDKKEGYGDVEEVEKDIIPEDNTVGRVAYEGKMLCSCGCVDKIEIESDFGKIIEFLLDEYGTVVTIDSGYRCPEYNKKVGGAKNSMHIKWPIQAADIRISGVSAKDIYKKLNHKFSISGLGYYLNTKTKWEFIHIDSRNYAARWLRVDGKYIKATKENLLKYSLDS